MTDPLDWVAGDPVALRRAYEEERASLDATAPAAVSVATEARPGLDGLHFTPQSGGRGAPILYFHGGSWMLGSPGTHRALCAWLAHQTDRRVISVAYPLAPEHPYPAQRDAARARLAAVLRHELGSVFVVGDSAGGAMALWAAEQETARVLGVVAFYPAYGLTASSSITAHGANNPALNAPAIAAMYARLGADPAELRADMSKAGAPVLVLAAERDPLYDDSLTLARDLEARGTTLWVAAGQEHAFLHHGGARAEVREWLAQVAAWMTAQERP